MKIAYLVNQYPKISHTFIRREIKALEEHSDTTILRFASRGAPEELVDAEDIDEKKQTYYLVSKREKLVLTCLVKAVTAPSKFWDALLQTARVRANENGSWVKYLAYLCQAAELEKQCNKEQVDHVHAHFGTSPAAIAMLCKTLGGPSFSFTVHGPEDFDRPNELSMKEKIASADAVVAISSYCKSQLSRWCDYEHWSKIHIVRCMVGNSFLSTKPAPFPEHFSMLSIGRICEQKGQMIIVEAIKKLSDEGVSANCGIVGDGELRTRLEENIRGYRLEDQIKVLGWKSGSEIQELLDKSSALLLPSFAEGLPVVIMEALARSRPVITTYIAGIPELVKDEKNGWLVPAGSSDELAVAIKKAMVAQTSRLVEMGAAGRKSVYVQHRDQTESAKLADLFKTCIQQSEYN